jgi:cytochrome c oxidase assembly factor CtaG
MHTNGIGSSLDDNSHAVLLCLWVLAMRTSVKISGRVPQTALPLAQILWTAIFISTPLLNTRIHTSGGETFRCQSSVPTDL